MAIHVKTSWTRTLTLLAAACGLAGAAAPLHAAPVAQLVQSGFNLPTFVTSAPGDYSRMFVLEKAGLIKIMDMTSPAYTTLATPFLDLTALVNTPSGTTAQQVSEERGLLGLAFHPQFQSNGKFYVYYSSKTISGLPSGYTFYNTIVEYVVRPSGSTTPDPTLNQADPASARVVLRILKPQTNHNGGWMSFGPDGYLYVSTGDGGNGGDTGAGHNAAIGNAQDTGVLLGKILRLDINSVGPAPQGPLWTGTNAASTLDDSVVAYGIPPDNPTLPVVTNGTSPARREIWAYGLRNPWRNSFDRLTGDLWIADVGQDSWEELDFQPALTASNLAQVAGRNYGWRCFEGTVSYSTNNGACPATYNTPPLTSPIGVYSHGQGGTQPPLAFPTTISGIAVTGGYVYRGCRVPELYGRYLFTDYNTSNPSRIYSTTLVGGVAATPVQHNVFNGSTAVTPNVPAANPAGVSVVSFGEDAYGEVYIVNQSSGRIFKLVTDTGGVPLANVDYNRNGQVDLLDIFNFLNKWFSADPLADFNRVNGVELLDIFAFLQAWFAGCPG